jgi:hypothetical protein
MDESPEKMPGGTCAHRSLVILFREATGLAIAKFLGIYIEAVDSAGPHPESGCVGGADLLCVFVLK